MCIFLSNEALTFYDLCRLFHTSTCYVSEVFIIINMFYQWLEGGAHGAAGCHVQSLVVVVVKGPDNEHVITPHHQGVGLIVLVAVTNNRVVAAPQLVLVRRTYSWEIVY